MGNERLRAQRKLRGWSQQDVVRGLVEVGIEIDEKQLGVTRHLVSRWERGITSPRAPYPKLLCLLFKVTAEELGLISLSPAPPASFTIGEKTIEDNVERRIFLRLAMTAPLGMALPSNIQPLLSEGSLEAIALVTDEYSKADDRIPSHRLLGPVLAHLDHVRRLVEEFGWSPRLATIAANTAFVAAKLTFSLCDYRSAGEHHRASITYAERAGNPVLEAYMVGHLGYWADEVGLPDEAARCLGRAQSLAPPDARARLAVLEASIQARARDTTGCLDALGRAEEAVSLDDDPLWPEGYRFDEARVIRYRGACTVELGRADLALPALEQALMTAPSGPSKLRGRILADLARAYVHTGEVEEACRLTGEAFEISAHMAYGRLLERVGDLRRQLAPWRDTQAVRELEERVLEGMV